MHTSRVIGVDRHTYVSLVVEEKINGPLRRVSTVLCGSSRHHSCLRLLSPRKNLRNATWKPETPGNLDLEPTLRASQKPQQKMRICIYRSGTVRAHQSEGTLTSWKWRSLIEVLPPFFRREVRLTRDFHRREHQLYLPRTKLAALSPLTPYTRTKEVEQYTRAPREPLLTKARHHTG